MAVTISLYSVIFLICVSQVLSEEYGATCAVAPNVGTPVAEQEPVVGVVTLSQNVTGENGGPTTIVISLTGFNKTDANLEHGFHIHESGDITGGCGGAGGHYNPNGVDHGAQTGTTSTRHVGDLGNIEEDTEGAVSITIIDNIVQLWGEHSVIGRAIVVHEKRDDLGLGGDEDSITTGNAGSRLACCKIMSTTGTGNTATSNKAVLSSALGMALIFLLKH